MIKQAAEWKNIHIHELKYSCLTLADFLAMIKSSIPEGTKDEDICLDFQIDDYDDYNIYGEKFTAISAQLNIAIKK